MFHSMLNYLQITWTRGLFESGVGQVYLLPVIIQRRLGAEIPGLVDVLKLPEDVYAGKYIHDDVHKSQLYTDTLSTQHIHKQSAKCSGNVRSRCRHSNLIAQTDKQYKFK